LVHEPSLGFLFIARSSLLLAFGQLGPNARHAEQYGPVSFGLILVRYPQTFGGKVSIVLSGSHGIALEPLCTEPAIQDASSAFRRERRRSY